jgi:hypothetical protein
LGTYFILGGNRDTFLKQGYQPGYGVRRKSFSEVLAVGNELLGVSRFHYETANILANDVATSHTWDGNSGIGRKLHC